MSSPTSRDPLGPIWSGAVVLRVVTWFFAAGSAVVNGQHYANPGLGWTVIGVMAGWTVLTTYLYSRESSRWLWLAVADLALSCALMATSKLVLTDEQMIRQVPLITTVWVAGVVAVGGASLGRVGGLAFGGVLAGFNFWVRGYVDIDLVRDAVLLMGIGFVIGMTSESARRASAQLAQALRTEAATAERERLARSIHDGVLQVLARVRKRGAELGGEAAELAGLAGEQEIALRALVAAAPAESTTGGEVDLRAGLQILATPAVQVSVPATQVMLCSETAGELLAVVRQALSNVERHAGPGARAWVLLEDLGSAVVVSVRDDGPGIAEGRLADAAAEGRLGVAQSMRGRVAALGGTLVLETGPDEGTEWEIRISREGPT